ncbi:MAG: DUF4129 domain-containing protein [Anaerolineales bacterium]|nr:DUF4129 domain-containing protein [Anaerolineales bacterium]
MSSLKTAHPPTSLGFPWPLRLSQVRLWREMAALACLGMSLSWTVPWFRSLSQATAALSSGRVFFVLGVMGVAAYLSVKAMVGLQLHVKIRQRVMIGLLLVSVWLGLRGLLDVKEVIPWGALILSPLKTLSNFPALIPNEFLIAVFVLLAWRRGSALAFASISPETVRGDFQGGLAGFFFFTLLNTLVTGETVPALMLQSFFLFSLLAMGMARVATLGELRGGTNSPFERRRILSLLVTTVAIVEFAYWLAWVMSGDDAALPALLLGVVFFSALLISIPLLLLLVYGLFWLLQNYQAEIAPMLEKVGEAFRAFMDFMAQIRQDMEAFAAVLAEKLAFLKPLFQWFFDMGPVLRVLVLGGVLILIMGLVLLNLYIREQRRRALYGETLDSVFSAQDFLNMLRNALRQRGQDAAKFLANLLPNEQHRAAARIRRIYAELMALCGTLNHPRPEALTPLEFLPALDKLFPASREDLHTITAAYLKVRYGELPETRIEVRAVEAAWGRVKGEGEKVKRDK